MIGTWKTSVTKVEGGSVTPIDLVGTSQEGADFSGTAVRPLSTYTGTIEGEVTRFGKIVMEVIFLQLQRWCCVYPEHERNRIWGEYVRRCV